MVVTGYLRARRESGCACFVYKQRAYYSSKYGYSQILKEDRTAKHCCTFCDCMSANQKRKEPVNILWGVNVQWKTTPLEKSDLWLLFYA